MTNKNYQSDVIIVGGGMHGHRSLEGTFLGGCVITARVAAKSITGKML